MEAQAPRIDLKTLPRPQEPPVAVRVLPAAERVIREGHPWLFEGSITSESRTAPAGAVAVVFDRKNRFLAVGLYDPESPIRVRLLAHGKPTEVGEALFRSRIQAALARRQGVASENTTGLRILHGENDGMPGLVADLYGRTLVLKLYTPAWVPHLRSLVPALAALLAPERILLLNAKQAAEGADMPDTLKDGGLLTGPPPEDGLPFLETGLHFEAHPFEGHKTGFYLDHRDNRRRLEKTIEGGRVLNVFSHTGAFSVYAARAGATEVLSVDGAEPALAQAKRHFVLNGSDRNVAACRHHTRAGDAFEVMQALAASGERFTTVVVDPPSFATAAAQRNRALGAYGRLTSLALSLLEPGGLLVQASCSTRVPDDAFFAKVHEVARAVGAPLEEVARTGHPIDHPVGFPEGAYLKCLWGRTSGGT